MNTNTKGPAGATNLDNLREMMLQDAELVQIIAKHGQTFFPGSNFVLTLFSLGDRWRRVADALVGLKSKEDLTEREGMNLGMSEACWSGKIIEA